MKKSLLDIINCPTCKGDLDLNIQDQTNEEILTGSFACTPCNEFFPIVDSIPNFLPGSLRREIE